MSEGTILRGLLYVFAMLNAGLGVAALALPRRVARWVGFDLLSTASFGEIRGVYGGLFLGLAAAVVAAVQRQDGSGWLLALGLIYGGLAAGRLTSALLDGAVRYTLLAALVEVGGTALLVYAALRLE